MIKTDLRKIFFEELIKLAEKDEKVVLIIPDVGFSFTNEFAEKFPDRYFNFGITEASTMIIASTMALSGLKPYVYSMINFVVFRPFEMVRNAIGYHNANVKLLGVSGSEKYKFLGFSHNITEDEDIYVLQKIPNLKSYAPKEEEEARKILRDSYESKEPTYIRL